MQLLDLDAPCWSAFVEARADASLFHHPAWARLLSETYGYRAVVLAHTDTTGAVTAGFPALDVTRRFGGRRWVSLPFSDWCPPLASGQPGELIAGAREIARSQDLDVLEMRGALPPHPAVQSSAAFVRHELALSADASAAWKGVSQNHRRNLRSAERSGVRITRGSSAAELETFYRLFLGTRRRLGVPIQPRRFFRLLLDRVIEPGLGVVLTAYVGDVPAAAAVFGAWNQTVVYKFGARDERFARSGANHLLFWTAIQWASDAGYRKLDFGRTALDQPELGRFKSGWGAKEEILPYSWIASAPVKPSSGRLEGAMAVVIRNSAPWLCRAVGEVFYRYAA